MCARYKIMKVILDNPSNKWCIYIDSDMIVRKNLSDLINNIENNNNKSAIFVQHQRKFSKIKNNIPYSNDKMRDPNIIFNTGFIGLNNTLENKLFLENVVNNIGICLKSDKLCTKPDKNKIWLPDQYSFFISYLEFKNKIIFNKLELSYNNHYDIPLVKSNKELLFNDKFHIWHCITLFEHPKFQTEFNYYSQEFIKYNK